MLYLDQKCCKKKRVFYNCSFEFWYLPTSQIGSYCVEDFLSSTTGLFWGCLKLCTEDYPSTGEGEFYVKEIL